MQSIGPYELVGELGRGGAGVIYRARDPGLQRDVAIKLLSNQRSPNSASLARFRQEAEALARLRHPHVVRVHTAGEHEGMPYLVMDLVEGSSLAARIRESGPLPVEEALRIALDLTHALEHMHAQALLHRDLKPDNVLLTPDGVPLLTDFGLVKDRDSDQALSREGAVMGTPGYWPPEQATGQLDKVGPTADVYGLGGTLYAMLTGVPPVQGDTVRELLVATCEKIPEPPSTWRPEISPAVDALCARCLAKAPRDRFPDAAALASALERVLAGGSIRERPPYLAPALLVVVLACAGAWFGWGGAAPGTPGPTPVGARPAETLPEDLEPDRELERCLAALESGEQVDVELAAGALSSLAPLPAVSLERLRELPRSGERDYLLALALLLEGRAADASAVVGRGNSPLQRAVQLYLDSEVTWDGTALLTGGAAAGQEIADRLELLLEEATRVVKSEPGAVGRLGARRVQSCLAEAIASLRLVQPAAHQYLEPRFYARAIALVEGFAESGYLEVVQAWVWKDLKAERPLLHRAVCERLIEQRSLADWEPEFVFLRGYLLLEHGTWPDVPLDVGIEAGSAGSAAAEGQAWVYERYVHQDQALHTNLSRAYLLRGGPQLVRSGGEAGSRDVSRAYVMAMRALMLPQRQDTSVPDIERVDAAWISRLERSDRTGISCGAVALLMQGRYEQVEAMGELYSNELGEDTRQLLQAELELIRGDVVAAHDRLTSLSERRIGENYRDVWGALAHTRHLRGDPTGAADAIRTGLRRTASLGIAWHDPAIVPEVLAGEGWWPGVGSSVEDE